MFIALILRCIFFPVWIHMAKIVVGQLCILDIAWGFIWGVLGQINKS